MRCPTLIELPPPPPGKTGWPWTEESPQLPDTMPDGKPWPRVSIVTPSLNQGQFIEETIRSVLLQGYPNLEYIIMDGGSTDNSIEIIKKYEPWIAYWESKKDKGQAHAINKGFKCASGEIIAWLNSDDIYLPEAIKEAGVYLALHPDVMMVYGDCIYIDENGNELNTYGITDFSLEKMLERNIVPQPSSFLKREILKKIGYLNEKHSYSFDFEWFLKIALDEKIVALKPLILSKFRTHERSKSMTHRIEFNRENIEILKNIPKNKLIRHNALTSLTKGLLKMYIERYRYCLNSMTLVRSSKPEKNKIS